MNYSHFASIDDAKKYLVEKNDATKSGLPIFYKDNLLYIDDSMHNTLVIGCNGSGKTQTITLPSARLAINFEESFLIRDKKGELLELLYDDLKANDYNIIKINLKSPTLGNHYNPLDMAYNLYKQKSFDQAYNTLFDTASNLFYDPQDRNNDPYWVNSAISYFCGIAWYLFEQGNENKINLNSLFDLAYEVSNNVTEFLKQISVNTKIYIQMASIINSPKETRDSIASVFVQKLEKYVIREELSEMMKTTDFDITKIGTEKTAIFIIDENINLDQSIVTFIISQIYSSIDIYGNKEHQFLFLLDDFAQVNPINNFAKKLMHARSINVRFVLFISSYLELSNAYGDEYTESLKICCENLVYLLSNDIPTVEYVSKLCGNHLNETGKIEPLISISELKTLDYFESIILIPRIMPFKSKLKPDYQRNL